jgi:PKHD-type hydroxylase
MWNQGEISMNVYPLLPPPGFGAGDSHPTYWHDAFTSEELDHVVQMGKQLNLDKATIGGFNKEDSYEHIRSSNTSWITLQDSTTWLYSRMGYACRMLNGKHYRFDLWGMAESLQFTEYLAEQEGHYSWHQDSGMNHNYPPRKLSMVVQLTDPNSYEGGDLQLFLGHDPITVERKRGLITVFPSFVLHRVTPVTSGVRHSLVSWVCGPAFK